MEKNPPPIPLRRVQQGDHVVRRPGQQNAAKKKKKAPPPRDRLSMRWWAPVSSRGGVIPFDDLNREARGTLPLLEKLQDSRTFSDF